MFAEHAIYWTLVEFFSIRIMIDAFWELLI